MTKNAKLVFELLWMILFNADVMHQDEKLTCTVLRVCLCQRNITELIRHKHTCTDASAVWGITEHRSILKDILLTSRLDHKLNIKISKCIIQQAPWILYPSITSCKDKHGLIHYVYGDSGSRGAVFKSVKDCEGWREMIRTVPEIILAVLLLKQFKEACRLKGGFY